MDFTSRPAREGDYATFVRLFEQLETHDPVMPEPVWVQHFMPEMQVHEVAGALAAYTVVKPLGEVGSVLHVVVDHPHRGQGLGLALMKKHATDLRARGCTSWFLHVKQDNAPAIRTYEKCGMRIVHEAIALRLPWEAAARLPRAEGARADLLASDDAAAIAEVESAFDIVKGRIASLGAIGRKLVRLSAADGALVGFGAFDPGFPGAMPVRVKAPEHLGPLLDALQPHARPEHDFLGLVVEAAPQAVAVLRDAGAEVRFAMHQMRGTL